MEFLAVLCLLAVLAGVSCLIWDAINQGSLFCPVMVLVGGAALFILGLVTESSRLADLFPTGPGFRIATGILMAGWGIARLLRVQHERQHD